MITVCYKRRVSIYNTVLTGWSLLLTHIPEDGCEVDGEAPVAEPSATARPVGQKQRW